MMIINFPVEEAVRKRYSVRNYKEQEIEEVKRKAIEAFVRSLDNPFGKKVSFHFLDKNEVKNGSKLGTYGVIKGASRYIGATITKEPMALEALGYELETVILYLAHMGIGTCWLGGTFDRKEFAKAMELDENELFPVITPYGYPADKKHIKEKVMRTAIHADHRKEWDQLFFRDNFGSPLSKTESREFELPLEMVRLGPSASNKQPWRVVKRENGCHFYEYKEPGYSKIFPFDIQRIDMGIAAAHFDLAARERGLTGRFITTCQPEIAVPSHVEYVFSWIRE